MEFSSETEYEANCIAQRTNIAFILVLLVAVVLNGLGVFTLPHREMVLSFVFLEAFTIPALVIGYVRRCQGSYLRYFEMLICLLHATCVVTFAGHDYMIVFIAPLVLASAYLDRRFLFKTYVYMILGMIVAAWGNAYLGIPDANLVTFDEGQIVAWREDIENVCREVGYNRARYMFDAVRYCTGPNVLFSGIVLVFLDGAMRVGRRRAEAAEAYSQGLLDMMGPSRRTGKGEAE